MSIFTLRGVWRISSRIFTCGSSKHYSNHVPLIRWRKPHAFKIASPCFMSLAWFAASTQHVEEHEDEEWKIKAHFSDLEDIYQLRKRTLICQLCGKRKVIRDKVEGIDYCICSSPNCQVNDSDNVEGLDWVPFLEQKDILVWRKAHPKLDGLYAYKMYGIFHDVSPKEFLSAQLDISDFRKTWDTATVECRSLHESSGNSKFSIDQIYYWEVAWPKFFANRDYVCQRRVRMNEDTGRIVVYTEAVTHPECPRYNKKFRVEDYVSILTIQSTDGGNMESKGLEFTLTAFENPGLSLPTSITTWVTMRALPQYILEMRRACLQKKNHNLGLVSSSSNNKKDYSNQQSGNCALL